MTTRLQTVDEWATARPDLYAKGRASFDWRWRLHKRRYLQSGAVWLIGDRRMVDPAACERLELELAREAAEALLAREGAGA
jgi:hypothetical protein